MRIFDYSHISDDLRDNDVCNLISAIREYRGKQSLFIAAKPDVLKNLLEIARIQSTSASNRIEGISTSDARLKALMAEKTEPRDRNEEEIVSTDRAVRVPSVVSSRNSADSPAHPTIAAKAASAITAAVFVFIAWFLQVDHCAQWPRMI